MRTNGDIIAPEVRVIDNDGKMLGVMAPADALRVAEDQGLDLIEIAPSAKPPTCRIMDYGKWKFEAQKKDKIAKKKQTVIVLKEIQIRPRTDEHDLNVKLRHARKFLLGGDKVKVNLRFYGREMAHQELGVKMLLEVAKRLDDIANVESPPKKEGRQVFVLLAPDAKKIKEFESSKPKEAAEQASDSTSDKTSDKASDQVSDQLSDQLAKQEAVVEA